MQDVQYIENVLFKSKVAYKYHSSDIKQQWKNTHGTAYLLTTPDVASRRKILKKNVSISHKQYMFDQYEIIRELNEYSTNYWIMRSTVENYNLKVRRGQKPHRVRSIFVRDDQGEVFEYASYVYVYNIDQLKENSINIRKTKCYNKDVTDQRIEQWLIDNKIRIHHNTNTAKVEYYDNRKYYVAIPNFSQFTNSNDYYAVLMHEVGHYIRFRTNKYIRDNSFEFGSDEYAFEELVAELTSVLICEKFGIEVPKQRNISYLYAWLSGFASDCRYQVFKYACICAEKVVAHLKFNVI